MFDPYNFPISSFTLVTSWRDVAYLICDKTGEWILMFWCPGCNAWHSPRVRVRDQEHRTPEYLQWISNSNWQWNGSLLTPTISPSLLVNKETPHQCHSFINNGQIQYLGDSYHQYANQTIPLPTLKEVRTKEWLY